MCRVSCFVPSALVAGALSVFGTVTAGPLAERSTPPELSWHTDYAEAVEVAKEEGKMLLLRTANRSPAWPLI